MIKFPVQTITAGSNTIFGESSLVDELKREDIRNYSIFTVEVKSATSAGVATVSFDLGNGYNTSYTQNAGSKPVSYFFPGTEAVKVAIATEDSTVLVTASCTEYV